MLSNKDTIAPHIKYSFCAVREQNQSARFKISFINEYHSSPCTVSRRTILE